MGIVDVDQHFHVVAMVVCYKEDTEEFAWAWAALERLLRTMSREYKPEDEEHGSMYTVQDAAGAIHEGVRLGMGTAADVITALMC